MLYNAYLLAKIGADTAKNEQHFAKILPKTGNFPTVPRRLGPRRLRRLEHALVLGDRVVSRHVVPIYTCRYFLLYISAKLDSIVEFGDRFQKNIDH